MPALLASITTWIEISAPTSIGPVYVEVPDSKTISRASSVQNGPEEQSSAITPPSWDQEASVANSARSIPAHGPGHPARKRFRQLAMSVSCFRDALRWERRLPGGPRARGHRTGYARALGKATLAFPPLLPAPAPSPSPAPPRLQDDTSSYPARNSLSLPPRSATTTVERVGPRRGPALARPEILEEALLTREGLPGCPQTGKRASIGWDRSRQSGEIPEACRRE